MNKILLALSTLMICIFGSMATKEKNYYRDNLQFVYQDTSLIERKIESLSNKSLIIDSYVEQIKVNDTFLQNELQKIKKVDLSVDNLDH